MKKNAERVFKLSWSHLFIIFDGTQASLQLFSVKVQNVYSWDEDTELSTSGAHFKQLLCSSHGCVFTKIIMKYIYKAWTFNLKNIDLSTQNRTQINYTIHTLRHVKWKMSDRQHLQYTHIHKNAHTCTQTYTHTACSHMCMCAHTNTCMHTQTREHTRIHAHRDIHAYTHTQHSTACQTTEIKNKICCIGVTWHMLLLDWS